ncbi:carboxymuconolactone decarboxylase family protein [Nocardia seriolae]|uniref:4-carboxymuconolactone decarboxylase n=1 Tax=Nocardia seriolae TaxID=37332 RepID=A0A0B8N5X5_9NOCA|nr:carboxymuconolactone decarboxylase family protein [Nocardia seriolae]MTJ60455.1 carboxymuconolactone decarboxylase family protein [Nocardia seriolae]MTJ72493.1 carboxymuconolactone decarboxylase family protein [Nocardia seriolae]MTJ84657.1 carboxymuconolactone decarboxylase family protein [Nocardia seriolae]MTK28645.1 carboxymuconolactone decarboxylase family protein [Nocardia seriolae]MTK38437.1 carboxymuconolactone decarboxylase family protein [Nocardia seriolae]
MVSTRPRIAPGRLRELGPVNWVVWQALSRAAGTEDAHLFSTLGRTGGLFRGWLHFSGRLMPGGKLRRYESELVILRVAHLRQCDYEMDHHIRLGRRAGVTAEILDRLREGPAAEGWTDKERALLTAVDQLVTTRDLDDPTWQALASHYDERHLIEIVLLTNQYEGLASTITALRIQTDH